MLSADRKKEIKNFLRNINIDEINEELIDEALTHPSFNFEDNKKNSADYERLEFLGDSVLRICVSDFLYEKYPDYDEGKLTKIRGFIVSDKFLSQIALKLDLGKIINIGKHEEKDGGRNKESILACALEALFGAIYKCKGFSYIKEYISNIYSSIQTDLNYITYIYNSKEQLQQFTQKLNKDLPEYCLIKEEGSSHNKTFEVIVKYNGEELGKGIANTKREAEKIAAFEALKKLKVCEINE